MIGNGFTTCLWFDDNAEAAADFYLSVFKDGKRGRVGHYNDAGPGEPGSVMVVEFEINGQKFIGLNGGPMFTFSEAVSFQIHCEDQAEVDHYWAALTADGGEESQCGWLKDRFGLSWQVVPAEVIDLISDPDPEKAARASAAVYTMKKIDLAAVKKAHAGG
ncbi:VOC family protein [Streptomyces sp. NBC_00536]|uniref:VOC family protein n=1 Tax=Streptomyces sp. NBC_00536 TaxID=2975769 RepID=UPI002E81C0F7|nr:VOC family protein [Streptomyces sp. NBC_00536]WUC77268.1 VOC family protein [Streptomyces sp. NBC_00536]